MSRQKALRNFRHLFGLTPTQFIIFGFLIIILIGTCLLMLPAASKSGESIGFVDALFTASSAVCVTGLIVVNTLEHWTVFGQIVIISLIQIGGLGFMTIVTMILVIAGKKITLKERMLIQESLNLNSLSGMVLLVKRIIIGTVFFESIGAVILAVRFSFDYGIGRGIYMGIFHGISAFCNAGFDVIGKESLVPYSGDVIVNVIIMSLIVIGGLGFTVWVDIYKTAKENILSKERRFDHDNKASFKIALRKLNLHSKVVLTITPFLIIGGAILFFILEYSNPETMGSMTLGNRTLASLMQSVTLRTAGFNSIDQGGMTYASKFLSIILMFIGGSPSGTAGGIKTTTIGVLLIAVLSVVRGSATTNIYERNIPFQILQRALAIFLISLGAAIAITMVLTITEKNMACEHEFIDLLFETVSALGTVGITTGITPYLSTAGKLIIAFAMFIGRLGPITIVIALAKKQSQYSAPYHFPEGKIMVG